MQDFQEQAQKYVDALSNNAELSQSAKKQLAQAYIAGARSRDKEIENIQVRHNMDDMWTDSMSDQIKFHDELLNYLVDRAIGDTSRIIEPITNNTHNQFAGYVKVTKSFDNMQRLILSFRIEDDPYVHNAQWQPIDNYAVWQTSGCLGDDYSGYLLFPTYDDDEYFCVWYDC